MSDALHAPAADATPPLVSVIMPFLNAEQYIRESINSVFAQTYSQWELLLVDDGSTDGSTGIARTYTQEHPDRVRYFEHANHEHKGASTSRNLGICHARGSYIAFLDADDVYLPHKLSTQVEILERRRDAAALFGATQYWYSWSGNPDDADRDWVWNDFGVETDTLIEPPRLLQTFLEHPGAVPCTCSLLLRRAAVARAGDFEDSFPSAYDDQVFYAKFFLEETAIVTGLCLDRYRQHAGSGSAALMRAGQAESARAVYLHWLEAYLAEHPAVDAQLREALRRALWPYRHAVRKRARQAASAAVLRSKEVMKASARRLLPLRANRWLRTRWRGPEHAPPAGWVDFGDLRRVEPLSRSWGFDRGQPVDRYYIEQFLAAHTGDVRGRVLEIADNSYTRRFGNGGVTRSDVLHPGPGNPNATIIADLASGDGIPSGVFDCVICTQTLFVIYDVRAVVRTLYRILKPGGVALVTVPGVSHHISRHDMDRWGDYWRFTSLSARRLFEEHFPRDRVSIRTAGNVLVAGAFLYGIAANELSREELDHVDADYEISIAIRAVKPAAP